MADTPTVAAAVNAVQQKQATPEAVAAPTEAVAPAKDERFEAMARKERQLHRQRKEIEAQRDALKQQITQYETGYIPKQRITEDPLAVLQEAGVSYEKLTEMLLSPVNSNDPTIRALKQQINALTEKQTKSEQAAQEASQKQYEDAIKQITSEVKMLVAGGDSYESIREMGMEDAVVELVEQTYNNEGYLMDIDTAAAQVEEHLLAEAEKMSKLKKLQSKLQAKASEVSEPIKPGQQSQLKTLTNAVAQQPTKRLSDKERIERAKAAFYGKLS